jgi:hypothetical protein
MHVYRPHKLQLLREIALLRERSRDITMGGSSVYDSNSSNSGGSNSDINSYNEDAASVGIYEVSKQV